jgi:hypothetical protein
MDKAPTLDEAGDLGRLPLTPVAPAPWRDGFEAMVRAGQPLVLRGAFESWPALAAGRRSPEALNAYLKAMDRGAMAPVMEAPPSSRGRFAYGPDMHEFSFSKRQCGISETLDRIGALTGREGAPYVAIQMLPLASHLADFVRENPLALLAAEVMPRLWIGGPIRTQTHHDPDHNLACVIAGRRRFLLFPPEQVANLYVGPLETPPPLSLVDPEAPDLARFPKFRRAMAAAQVAYLEPGDALFMPRYWWHHVTSLDPYNAMVNYWWGDAGEGLERASDCFQTALLALRDLPPGERAYWKAMFDTHVFRAGGDPVAHIPADLQGALGLMSPAFRRALKQQLLAAYLRSAH